MNAGLIILKGTLIILTILTMVRKISTNMAAVRVLSIVVHIDANTGHQTRRKEKETKRLTEHDETNMGSWMSWTLSTYNSSSVSTGSYLTYLFSFFF
ncbi:hypothetical protein O6P43_024225 [Quillaja saponaria]|uniref:Uncharacterized protein n=1 Tax=Quillaja saponaria TaxID=32244 RepID=A0AAD7L743_QUISA|nr:hypothetical protein O6P43_024225 [Quillaja saponaria]